MQILYIANFVLHVTFFIQSAILNFYDDSTDQSNLYLVFSY
jgi:hypothetical protein